MEDWIGNFLSGYWLLLCHFWLCWSPFSLGLLSSYLQGVNPIEAYQAMIVGAFGSKNGLGRYAGKSDSANAWLV